jgi:chromosomal replication initiator protein
MALAKETLDGVYSEEKKHVGIPQVQKAITEYYSLKPNDLKAKSRRRNLVIPRQLAMYLCREITDESLPGIGKAFGGRDHSTVIHACQKVKSDIETNTKLYTDMNAIKKMLEV